MTNAERVKQVRTRARIRRWEYRQRNLARGGWHRFRLALAQAREAYAVDEAQFATLVTEGFPIDKRGSGLVPETQLVWITPDRAASLVNAPRMAMQLDAAMLASRRLALVAFDQAHRSSEAVSTTSA